MGRSHHGMDICDAYLLAGQHDGCRIAVDEGNHAREPDVRLHHIRSRLLPLPAGSRYQNLAVMYRVVPRIAAHRIPDFPQERA